MRKEKIYEKGLDLTCLVFGFLNANKHSLPWQDFDSKPFHPFPTLLPQEVSGMLLIF